MSGAAQRAGAPALITDIASLRADFPALQQLVHGKPLAYLDNAASSQQSPRRASRRPHCSSA